MRTAEIYLSLGSGSIFSGSELCEGQVEFFEAEGRSEQSKFHGDEYRFLEFLSHMLF